MDKMKMFVVQYENHQSKHVEITHVLAEDAEHAIAAVWNASRFSCNVDILGVKNIRILYQKD